MAAQQKTNNSPKYAHTLTYTFPHFYLSSFTIHSKYIVIPCLFPVVPRVCVPAAVGIFTANKLNHFSFFLSSAEVSQWKETCPCRRGGLISGSLFCFYFSPLPDGWIRKCRWRKRNIIKRQRKKRENTQTYNLSDFVLFIRPFLLSNTRG